MHARIEKYSIKIPFGITMTGNQNHTHDPNYKMETISKKYDIDDFPEGMFPISFKIIYCYQWRDLGLIAKHK